MTQCTLSEVSGDDSWNVANTLSEVSGDDSWNVAKVHTCLRISYWQECSSLLTATSWPPGSLSLFRVSRDLVRQVCKKAHDHSLNTTGGM